MSRMHPQDLRAIVAALIANKDTCPGDDEAIKAADHLKNPKLFDLYFEGNLEAFEKIHVVLKDATYNTQPEHQ